MMVRRIGYLHEAGIEWGNYMRVGENGVCT